MNCGNCKFLQKEKYKDSKGIHYPFREYGCSKNGYIPLSIPILDGIPADKYLNACGCSDFEEKQKQMTIFDYMEEE